jgi:hypothetical protein
MFGAKILATLIMKKLSLNLLKTIVNGPYYTNMSFQSKKFESHWLGQLG